MHQKSPFTFMSTTSLTKYDDPKFVTNVRGGEGAQENEQRAASGVANSQWCRDPEQDEIPALPLDHDVNQCENSQLINVDMRGQGMTAQLNTIMKVALWASLDYTCFYINEGENDVTKLHYRVDENGNEYDIHNFLDRYFEHMGLTQRQWESMTGPYSHYTFITPHVVEINNQETGKKAWTTNDPKDRFRLRSIPSLGYVGVDNITLKKHFLRRMFRIRSSIRDRACQQLASQGLNDDYMALSIRRGDKTIETSILTTVEPYIQEAEKAIKSHFDGVAPTIFVATDDCSVMQEFREQRPHWTFVSECDNATEANGFVYAEMKHWTEAQTDAHFNKFIAEMIAMASAKFWIGVDSTNVSYWIYLMRPLDASDDTYVFVGKPAQSAKKQLPPRFGPALPW